MRDRRFKLAAIGAALLMSLLLTGATATAPAGPAKGSGLLFHFRGLLFCALY